MVAVVGAGGKTTLVYRAGDGGARLRPPVLVTTTTHMGTMDEAVTGPVLVDDGSADLLVALGGALARDGRATLLGRRVRPDKLEGIAPARVDVLAPLADLVLVEADGARGRSLEAARPPRARHPRLHDPRGGGVRAGRAGAAAGRGARASPRAGARGDRRRSAGRPWTRTAWPPPSAIRTAIPRASPRAPGAGVFLNKAEDDATLAAAARLAARLVPPYHWVAAGSARSGAVRTWPPMRRAAR